MNWYPFLFFLQSNWRNFWLFFSLSEYCITVSLHEVQHLRNVAYMSKIMVIYRKYACSLISFFATWSLRNTFHLEKHLIQQMHTIYHPFIQMLLMKVTYATKKKLLNCLKWAIFRKLSDLHIQYPARATTITELEARIHQEQYKFTKENCLKCIDSISNRIKAVIRGKGGPTRRWAFSYI